MEPISEVLKEKADKLKLNPVNSKDNNLSTVNCNKDNLNTVDSTGKEGGEGVSPSQTMENEVDEVIQRHYLTKQSIAEHLAKELGDENSLDYYIILTKENETGRLMEALSYTKDAARRGKIRTKKAVYFQAILRRRWGIKTRFKGLKKIKEPGRIEASSGNL